MNWSQGYTSKWKLYSVDKETWGEKEEIEKFVSASITKDTDSSLIEDASISIDGEPVNGYVRIVLEAKGTEGLARVDMGTFLVTSPKRSIKGTLSTIDLQCYSVLKPADDKLLPPGWYFPEGGDPIAGASTLLSESLQCPVDPTESDIKTDEIKVAESNETVLSMVKYLLTDTDYFIDINGKGRVTIKKKTDEIKATFDTKENDVLMPELSDESDIFDIPNVLRVSDSNGHYQTLVNNDENSETSVDKLGWEKWSAEQLTLDADETLTSKGSERLEKLSKSTRKIDYTREFNPDINVNDMVAFVLPRQGILGSFRIISQSLTIGSGATVKEIAQFESENWRA